MNKKKMEFLVLGAFIIMAVVFLINIFIARYERKSANAVSPINEVRKVSPAKEAAAPARKDKPAPVVDEPDTNTQTLPGGVLLQ